MEIKDSEKIVIILKEITELLNRIISNSNVTPSPVVINPRIYSCIATQSGINKPYVVVLKSDLGGIGWSRLSTGEYIARKAGAFIENKTVPTNVPTTFLNEDGSKIVVKRISNSDIGIFTYDSDGKLSDNILNGHYLEFNSYI